MKATPPASEAKRAANPYVGPGPYAQADAYRFFGRNREAGELYSLVSAHRTVLLYAQSGAGKTSLLNAGLVPMLEEGGFDVLPPARVSGISREDAAKYSVKNIYVLSFADLWAERSVGPNATFLEVLAIRQRRRDAHGNLLPRVAIFDQFEELFTGYPERWQDRRSFFEQLNEAMKDDPSLRVLFAMREDFVAQIDPYEDLLPEEFRTRYRLEQLREDAALAAVECPLEATGLRFKHGVAKLLVDDLLSEAITSGVRAPGEFVEPVQLQVVCFNLFRNLPESTTEITEEHLAAFGDVDQALREFYQGALKEAAGKAAIDEDDLRQWFETKLITEAGTRGLVFRGEATTGGIPDAAVDALEDLHIIRAEVRGRDRWYELSHDRFIRPILRANDTWRARVQAEERQRREEETRRLIEQERGEAARSRQRAEEQTRLARRFRGLFWGAATALLAAIVFALGWLYQHKKMERVSRESSVRALVLAADKNLSTDPELSILLALQAVSRTYGPGKTVMPEAEDALRQGLQALPPGVTMGGDEKAPRSSLSALAFSRDGTLLATGGSDRTVRVWDAASGAIKFKLFHHGYPVTSIAFSPDGTRLAAVSLDGAVSVWGVGSQQQLNTFSTVSWPSAVSLSPDARFLVAATANGEALVWDAQSGKELTSPLAGHHGAVTGATFSVDAKLLATANDDGTVIVWDGKTGRPRPLLSPGHRKITGMSFSGDATRLAVAGEDGTVTVWDEGSGKSLYTLPGQGNRVYALALSLDGNRIATVRADGRAELWDVASDEELPMRFPRQDYISGIAFSPDGQRLATVGVDGTAKVWDVSMHSAAEVVMTLPVPEAFSAAFSHKGGLLAIASDRGTAVRSVASGELLFSFPDWGAFNFAADDSDLAIVTSEAKLKVENLGTAKGELPYPPCSTSSTPVWADFSRDWSEMVISDVNGKVKVCHKPSGQGLFLNTSSPQANSIGAVSPDGKTIALGARDGMISLWDANSGGNKCSWKTHFRQTDFVAFSYNGKRLAAAGENNSAQIWDSSCSGSGEVESSKQLRATLSGHSGAVTAVAFSKDGTLVATGSLDGTAKVWDVGPPGNPKELYSFSHESGILYVDLSPDSGLLAATSANGYVRIYRLNIGIARLMTLAKERVHRNLSPGECKKFVPGGKCAQVVAAATE
ncbi:MAG: hypothetical protein ACRD2P_04110 [Terriglobia bacterium]